MGREIVYCVTCLVRLTSEDFKRGKAQQVANNFACSKCAVALLAALPPAQRKTSVRLRRTELGLPTVKAPLAEEARVDPKAAGRRKKLLVLGGAGGGGVLILVLILAVAFKGDGPEKPPVAASPPKTSAPNSTQKVQEAAQRYGETAAEKALASARKFGTEKPDDLEGRIRKLEEVALEWDKTASGVAATAEVKDLKAKLRATLEPDLASLDTAFRGFMDQEEFGKAQAALDEARKRHSVPEWGLQVSKRQRELDDRVGDLYGPLETQAVDHKMNGEAAKAGELRSRIEKWGLKERLERLDKALSEVTVAEKPATPVTSAPVVPKVAAPAARPALPTDVPPATKEGQTYRGRWEEAMIRAAARDHDGASAILARAAEGLAEDPVKKEVAADAEDVKRMAALWPEALKAFASRPKWTPLTLDTVDPLGLRTRVAGRVFSVDADRVELVVEGKKETAFVEWSELAGASLGQAFQGAKVVPDPRVLALASLIDGDVDAACAALGVNLGAVPAKYFGLAGAIRDRMPKGTRDEVNREKNARTVFYAAEREFRSLATRAAAVEKYRTLQSEYAGTKIVARSLARIEKGSQACREYFSAAADLKGAGSFKLEKRAPLEKIWKSKEDTDAVQTLRNFVEVEFCALPATPYRCWIYAGGCCVDGFDFYYQATDLFMPNSEKPKEPLLADTESSKAVPGKHSIKNLKTADAAHVKKKEPMEPTRWEWIEVALPKTYPGPGLKKLRLVTSAHAFSIGCVVVSSTRKAPPTEPEFKDLLKALAEERAKAPPRDPGLVGHWAFEEGNGDTAADAGGEGQLGKLENGAAWKPGRIGGAVGFNGAAAQVGVLDSPPLRLVGDLTISFWMKREAETEDWVRLVGKGDGKVRNYGLWSEPGGKKILFQVYNQDGVAVLNIQGAKVVETGKWAHVAAVVEGNTGRLYIDGVPDVTGTRTGVPGTSAEPLTFGRGPMHGGFNGLLDEVRLYTRALSADEVKGLAEQGR